MPCQSSIARQIWKEHFGEIPSSYHIHHIDSNKENNSILNLMALSSSEHGKVHARRHLQNYEFRTDGWWKTCRQCGKTLPLKDFPPQGESTRVKCKSCFYAHLVPVKTLSKMQEPKGIRFMKIRIFPIVDMVQISLYQCYSCGGIFLPILKVRDSRVEIRLQKKCPLCKDPAWTVSKDDRRPPGRPKGGGNA